MQQDMISGWNSSWLLLRSYPVEIGNCLFTQEWQSNNFKVKRKESFCGRPRTAGLHARDCVICQVSFQLHHQGLHTSSVPTQTEHYGFRSASPFHLNNFQFAHSRIKIKLMSNELSFLRCRSFGRKNLIRPEAGMLYSAAVLWNRYFSLLMASATVDY